MSDVERDSVFEGRAAGVVDGWCLVRHHPVRCLSRVEVITIDDRLMKEESEINDSSAVCNRLRTSREMLITTALRRSQL